MTVQVSLSFRPNQVAPRRASGRGIWRIESCGESAASAPIVVIKDRLFLLVTREFKKQSRVDPWHLVLAYFRSKR